MPLGEFLVETILQVIFEGVFGTIFYLTGIVLTLLTCGAIRAGDPIEQYRRSGIHRRVRRQRRAENPVPWYQLTYVKNGQRYLFAEATAAVGALLWVAVVAIALLVAIKRGTIVLP